MRAVEEREDGLGRKHLHDGLSAAKEETAGLRLELVEVSGQSFLYPPPVTRDIFSCF